MATRQRRRNRRSFRRSPLGELRDAFLSAHKASQEVKTLCTAKIHLNHLVATLGKGFDLRSLDLAHLQKHIDRRCPKVSPATAPKEVSTFRTAWNCGIRMKRVSGHCPVKGLIYPKVDEKPPFQTCVEIERQLDGLIDKQRAELWDALYLILPEIDALLADVKASAAHPWIYPFGRDGGPCRAEAERAGSR